MQALAARHANSPDAGLSLDGKDALAMALANSFNVIFASPIAGEMPSSSFSTRGRASVGTCRYWAPLVGCTARLLLCRCSGTVQLRVLRADGFDT